MTGIIFDHKEFAVFDGPGPRQTVFFKGCPLRCSWCHNPEGLCAHPQLMVSNASCAHCGNCIRICTHETCIACGDCVHVCPLHLRSIAGETVTAGELAGRILKNADYYAAYGGGVTFSGGEPLMQAAFLGEVLRLLPGVHCAVETSGYCQPSLFQEITALLDYVIMDIKLFDETRHRHFTGVSNRLILQNALGLCEGQIPFVIRIPVIPGVNDTDENYRQTAAFLSGARNLVRVEFLPYHKTAGAKYSMAGMEYQPQFDPEGSIHILQEIFGEYGIRSVIL